MPVTLDVDPAGSATITLDRYAKRNSLDRAMLASFADVLGQVEADESVRSVVLKGSGGYFCAGADIGDWADPGPAVAAQLSRLGTSVLGRLAALPVPTIAMIEVSAIGGGLELALACDLRVTSDDAQFGYPEARLGNLTSWGGIARLVDTVGLARTRQLFMSGTTISGAEALSMGLVTAAVAADDIAAKVEDVVGAVHECDPLALSVLKGALSSFEHRVPAETVMASFFSLSDASRDRKQAFFNRKTTTK